MRPHSAYYRLLTFAASHYGAEEIEQFLEEGLYFDQSLTGELRGFADQNALPSETATGARIGLVARAQQHIPLRFGLSHLKAQTFTDPLSKVSVSDCQRFLVVADSTQTISLFSFRFGLTLLWTMPLGAPSKNSSLPEFASLLKCEHPQKQFFAVEEAAKFVPAAEPAAVQQKPKAPEPAVDKKLLDELYLMGFSLELCKKALLEVNNASVEAAINVLINYTSAAEPQSPATTPTGGKVIKPEWSCEVCTFLNYSVENPSQPNVCSMCFTPAGPDAYTEEKVEAVEKQEQDTKVVVSKPAEFELLDKNDTITAISYFDFEKENLLNSSAIVIAVTNEKKESKLVVVRLAFNPEVLSKILVIDQGAGCPASTWFGKMFLNRDREERELGQLLARDLWTVAQTILPKTLLSNLFVAGSIARKEVPHHVLVEDLFVSPAKELNGRS